MANAPTLHADQGHFRFWADHSTRVAGVVYDPAEKAAYWVDVGQFLADNPERLDAGPYTVPFPKNESTRFDQRSFAGKFFSWALHQPPLKLDRAVESLHSPSTEAHAFGTYALASTFGCSAAAWDALFYEFEHRPKLSPSLVHVISMLGDHPDILWRTGMIVSDAGLRARLRSRLRALSYDLVRRLVDVIDDYGIERGTIGQCVDVILHEHASPGPHLRRVLRDSDDPWTIQCAAFLYAHHDPRSAKRHLARLAGSDEIIAMLVAAL